MAPGLRLPVLRSGVLLITLAAASLAAYEVIGSYLDEDGWLHEPFALIPFAWLAGLTGTALIAIAVWRRWRR